MKITVLTLFPEMFVGPFSESIIKRAQEKHLVEIKLVNIRDFGIGTHKVVDDTPYGGGVGMVMKVDVIDKAIRAVKERNETKETGETKVVLLDPRGTVFVQSVAKNFSKLTHLILLCGHYEGVDERVRDLVDETISIGDFISTGGEIPAMLLADAIIRLVPGVLKEDATQHDSFSLSQKPHPNPLTTSGAGGDHGKISLLEYPQYTTPQAYRDQKVPEILLSGNHTAIQTWREEKAKELTQKHRPDLLKASENLPSYSETEK